MSAIPLLLWIVSVKCLSSIKLLRYLEISNFSTMIIIMYTKKRYAFVVQVSAACFLVASSVRYKAAHILSNNVHIQKQYIGMCPKHRYLC